MEACLKQIKNYKNATVFDLETDALLEEVTKIHICGYKMKGKPISTFWGDSQYDRVKAMFKWHIDNQTPVVCHNAITFDIPVLEKVLGMDLTELMVIDTLTLSWYLNINHKRHSLEVLAQEYDVPEKFFVDEKDWSNLTKEQAVKRVTSDVAINSAVYDDFVSRLEDMATMAKDAIDGGLVGGKRISRSEVTYLDSLVGLSVEEHVNRLLTFLMFKTDVQRLQEKTGWDVDVPYLEKSIAELEVLVEEAANALESVMPKVPQYSKRKEPAKKFKKNGELSVGGANWERLVAVHRKGEKDEFGNPLTRVRNAGEIEELTSYNPPNINGHQQVKDFLFSYGWTPRTFKYVRDEEAFSHWISEKPEKGARHRDWDFWKNSKPEDRAIPQVRKDGEEGKELCESVEELAEQVPEISYLEEYSVIKHRLDTMKGILRRVDSSSKVEASWHGMAVTLRCMHRAPCVNLPAANKKYSLPIRGSLVAPEGFVSCGSDLSGLESRIAHHFMIPHDPSYVNTMLESDYDGHILMALSAGLITNKELEDFKSGIKPEHVVQARQQGKTASYAAAYGGGAASIAEGANVSLEIGKALHEGYWKLNWSIKTVAEEQVVVTDKKGFRWLVNPINGLCYGVRSDKDIWNTLCQGTGSYMFDMWTDKILTKQEEKWGKKTQTAAFHDEVVYVFRDRQPIRDAFENILNTSIKEVSEEFMLRRELGCDVQFGKRYSDIH